MAIEERCKAGELEDRSVARRAAGSRVKGQGRKKIADTNATFDAKGGISLCALWECVGAAGKILKVKGRSGMLFQALTYVNIAA